MHLNQTLLRATAVAAATVVMAFGAGASAQAAMVAGDASGKGAAQSAEAKSNGDAGKQTAADNQASAEENKQAAPTEQDSAPAEQDSAPAEQDSAPAAGRSGGEKPAASASSTSGTPVKGSAAQGPKGGGEADATPEENAKPNANGNAKDKSLNGGGHTPATVCHRLGNGGFIELTFDENALEAHMAHGDIAWQEGMVCGDVEPAPTADERDRSTERVTVCHRLGNGGFIELTFDDNALPAHEAHGDLEWTEGVECGAVAPETATGGTTTTGQTGAATDEVTSPEAIVGLLAQETAEVLGVQAERSTSTALLAERASAGRAPVAVAPVAGFLPATGAGDHLMLLVGGGALLAAGGAVLARRRSNGVG